jgi:hypothetical protein
MPLEYRGVRRITNDARTARISKREDRLANARRHVAEALERVQERVLRFEGLKKDGHDVTSAEQILGSFLSVLDAMTEHLDILEREARLRRNGSR